MNIKGDVGMIIYVCLKNMGNITKTVKKEKFYIEENPDTLRLLIIQCVRTCIKAFKSKNINSDIPSPLSNEEFEEMKNIGKFAFGINYNQNEISEEKAISIAMEAYNDGLVRIFKNGVELVSLDETLEISENDEFTFVKLTMLSGSMW